MPLILGQSGVTNFFIIIANLSSYIFDYISRQKVGGVHVNYFILKQLPILPPNVYNVPLFWEPVITLLEWIKPRVLELTYTAWDLEPFARDIGYEGAPFVWDEERRFLLRCELDAAYFHSMASKKTMSITSWTPFPSSNEKTKPNTALTEPKTRYWISTARWRRPSKPAAPIKPNWTRRRRMNGQHIKLNQMIIQSLQEESN